MADFRRRAWMISIILMTLAGSQGLFASASSAAVLTSMSVFPRDPTPSALTSYQSDITGTSAAIARCVTALIDVNAGAGIRPLPAGMSVTSPTLTNSSALTAGSWGTGAVSNNVITWTNPGGETLVDGSLVINGIRNPSAAGSYFLFVRSYTDVGCSTPLDNGSAELILVPTSSVSLTVDPSLSFSIAGHAGACNGVNQTHGSSDATSMSLGSVNRDTNAFIAQDLIVSANAANGYSVFLSQFGPMSDGQGHFIAPFGGSNASPAGFSAPGDEAFGYTTSDTTLGTGNPGRFSSSAFAAMNGTPSEVAYEPTGPVANSTTCVGYQIGVSPSTPSGNYGTTVQYQVVPSY